MRHPARQGAARLVQSSSGQNLAEFAIVSVLLILLVIGIAEFARAWNVYQIITNAAREGARLAALPAGFTTDAEVNARVTDYLASGNLDQTQATITIGRAGVDGATGTQVSVAVSYPYQFTFLGPVIRLVDSTATAGSDITIQSEVVMRNE